MSEVFTLSTLPKPVQPLYKYFSKTPKCLHAFRKKEREKERERETVRGRMIRLRSKKLFKRSSKLSSGASGVVTGGCGRGGNIEWELRPGGMLVQKREGGKDDGEGVITVRVSTGSHWHDISIGATSTFGELKMVVSMVTGLEPREQRLLFRGKEREDGDHLHMVGVGDRDKVLLLEDPAIKEMKLRATAGSQDMGSPCHTIIEV